MKESYFHFGMRIFAPHQIQQLVVS
jgi:hypothetical protein